MFESLISTNHISFILVFLEGIISFFSPCVLPLIPVYISYLAGNTKLENEDGTIQFSRKKVLLHTISFVLGISFAFFILGMAFSTLGSFFKTNQIIFTRIGGILIVLMGLFQLGVFDFKFLQRERKFHLNLGDKKVNPFLAFIMGFTFSFAWTPCVGPALSSVLILASGAKSTGTGNLLVLVYTIGFIIPFIALGLFTTQALNFLKKKQKLLRNTIKVGGIILIIMGIMTFTGWMNGISGYLNSFTNTSNNSTKETTIDEDKIDLDNKDDSKSTENEGDSKVTDKEENNNKDGESLEDSETAKKTIPAFDFTLTDQYGDKHTLSDYKGKVVFLNFWATWCPPCKKEMPHIEELYQEYNYNKDDVIILGVANPKSEQYPNNSDEDIDTIKAFLKDNNYTFPVVFDETGELSQKYYISAFPTTFMIDKDGNVYGYIPGMLTKDIMKNIINETLESTK